MTPHIALLRAVNVAGHNKIRMADLVGLLGQLGLTDGRALLQSGNLVFRSDRAASAPLEGLLANAAKERLGLATDFFVRSAVEWREVVAGNPFHEEAERDPGHLVAMVLKEAPGAERAAALRKAITGREVVHLVGRQAYIVYPDGIGRSRLTSALVERTLATRGTARNWNTVLRLAASVEA